METAQVFKGWWNVQRIATCLGVFSILVSLAVTPPAVVAEEFEWAVYAGRWAVQKPGTASELGFEVRRPFKDTGFDIVGGLAVTDDEAIWAYAGAAKAFRPSDKWIIRPGFAVSVFENGDGKDLGGPIEFRSSLEASYLVRQNLSVGLLVHHLSNAGFYDRNPGSNSILLVLGFP